MFEKLINHKLQKSKTFFWLICTHIFDLKCFKSTTTVELTWRMTKNNIDNEFEAIETICNELFQVYEVCMVINTCEFHDAK